MSQCNHETVLDPDCEICGPKVTLTTIAALHRATNERIRLEAELEALKRHLRTVANYGTRYDGAAYEMARMHFDYLGEETPEREKPHVIIPASRIDSEPNGNGTHHG